MDFDTIVIAVASSAGLSSALQWFSQTLVKHQLSRDLATHKALVEGSVRREIEAQLAEKAANRSYEWDARKRLYSAIGPLRFQLILACRSLAGRIGAYATTERSYSMDVRGYYGRSTLYRLLKPLAIAELIEQQVAYADFAVDTAAIDCLRFKQSAARILSGGEIVGAHPHVDWSCEREHVFSDSITSAAHALVTSDAGANARPLRFDEFRKLPTLENFEPFVSLLDDFAISRKPLFWLRLVALAQASIAFALRAGQPIGLEIEPLEAKSLVELVGDRHIQDDLSRYLRSIELAASLRL
jgi:hypothetical protein